MFASYSYLQTEAHVRIGKVVNGRWALKRLLGIGGMAAVYEAADSDGTPAALKIVHQTLLHDDKVFQRLRREMRVVNSMTHPGIVPVHDLGRDEEGSFFLVMSLLTGHSFDDARLLLGGRLEERYVRWVATELLNVLAAAHGRGVLHRDIKPSNLFITKDGTLRVLDFGVARRKDATSSALSLQTAEGSVLGTPTFMSPEQARGRWREVDERSDIWSVGASLFTLASGRPVHEADNSTEALGLAMTANARSLADLRPDFSPFLVDIIDRALAFGRSDRYDSAGAMYDALTNGSVRPSRAQCANPELARALDASTGKIAIEPNPSLHTTVGHTGRARASAPANVRMRMPSRVPADWVTLLKTRYWEVFEVPAASVLILRRSTEMIDSTAELREENLQVAGCLAAKHRRWGGVVDMRLAPGRGDRDFEQAMGFLRHTLSVHLARLSVLVTSAAGVLQVSRIDRVEGKSTLATQNEAEALRFASGD